MEGSYMGDPVTGGQQSWEPEPLHIPLYNPSSPRNERDPSWRSPAGNGTADDREPGSTVIVIDLA